MALPTGAQKKFIRNLFSSIGNTTSCPASRLVPCCPGAERLDFYCSPAPSQLSPLQLFTETLGKLIRDCLEEMIAHPVFLRVWFIGCIFALIYDLFVFYRYLVRRFGRGKVVEIHVQQDEKVASKVADEELMFERERKALEKEMKRLLGSEDESRYFKHGLRRLKIGFCVFNLLKLEHVSVVVSSEEQHAVE